MSSWLYSDINVQSINMLQSVKELSASVKRTKYQRIGVDGINGARKSSIAVVIAKDLQLELVSLDDYLQKNKGGYVEFLHYEDLMKKLRSLDSFIVEGVCLLEVLDRIEISIDCLVYIKRYHLDMWADERELVVDLGSVEDFLVKEREIVAMLSGESDADGPSLEEDIIRYHSKYRPQDRADITYRWDDL